MRPILVSASNSKYFPLLKELISSISALEKPPAIDLGILDVGLTEQERTWLLQHGTTRIVKPNWPFNNLDAQPEWYKAIVCRPFIPHYFQEWSVIVWSDADAWMQNPVALELALTGAELDGFAVIPMIDRGYWLSGFSDGSAKSAVWQENSLAEGFGAEIATQLRHYPLIFGSFFAGARTAPHWNIWANLLATALQRKVYFSAEQAALTVMVHRSGLRTHFLPNYCHWACHVGLIGLDMGSNQFTEPGVPFHPVSMLALPADTKERPVLVRTREGLTISRLLRFSTHRDACPTNVVVNGQPIEFDGIAQGRFRNKLFDKVSATKDIRFVQIGAMDGKAFDPLHDAIRRHRWSGLLVEPMPDMMAKLRENYKDVEGLEFAETALCSKSGMVTMKRVRAEAVEQGRVPLWAAGLTSLAPERTALSGRSLSAEQFSIIKSELEDISVEGITFEDLSARYHLQAFDVLQIDAEGLDYQILRQVDLARFQPLIVHFEINNLPVSELQEAVLMLRKTGYRCFIMEDGQDLLACSVTMLRREKLE